MENKTNSIKDTAFVDLRLQKEQVNNKANLHDTNTPMAESMLNSANILDFDKILKKA